MERFLDAPEVVFNIGPIPVTETVLNSWFLMVLLIAMGALATRRLDERPRGVQSVAEVAVEGLRTLMSMTMGRDKLGFLGYMGSLFAFILLANISGVLGLRPPTSDVNITLGLAAITFVMVQYYGAKTHGLGGYVRSLAAPMAFLFPLNIIGELARPVSLGVRLFGNIIGGSIIMAMIYGIIPLVVPIPLHLYFDVFVGLLQTFIFVVLTMVFVSLAME